MFVLHVEIQVNPGRADAARAVFAGPFKAAISAQPGFRDIQYLQPDDDRAWVLTIAFENHAQQQAWVATDLHTKVWASLEANFDSYTVRTFRTV